MAPLFLSPRKKIKVLSIPTKYCLGYLTEGFEPSTSPDPSLVLCPTELSGDNHKISKVEFESTSLIIIALLLISYLKILLFYHINKGFRAS